MKKFLGRMHINMKVFCLMGVIVCSAFAEEAVPDSMTVVQRQMNLLEKLDSLNAKSIGFALDGSAKAGYLRSSIDADELVNGTTMAEASAYTRMNLVFSARPSSETVAKFNLRMQKDWQNAHREGNNSPITTWWSYDGRVVNNHLSFNLGHMRVAYTPFTVYQPEPDLIFEPKIFEIHRKNVMADKNLDGSNGRLMQGLNAAYTTGSVGRLDDIRIHGSMARLRNVAKKSGQVFFDFDESDRYMFAGNASTELAGVSLGLNDVYSFDRVRSSRILARSDSVYYERNNVLSVELNFDSKKVLPDVIHFGAGIEYAVSYWRQLLDDHDSVMTRKLSVIHDSTVTGAGVPNTDAGYLAYKDSASVDYDLKQVAALKNKSALQMTLFAEGSFDKLEYKADGHFLSVDKGFQAELAMTPVSLSNIPVLNSGAVFSNTTLDNLLPCLRSGSLENLYFSLYESVPLNSSNMLTVDRSAYEADYYRLYNNYKYAQYYRNGYNNVSLKRAELLNTSFALDPSTDIALPFGLATPNRRGGSVNLNGVWNDAISARIVGGYYSADEIQEGDSVFFASGSQYLRMGGGVNVDFARIFSLPENLGIEVGGSFDMTKETDYLERDAKRTMLGANVSWNKISLLLGYQMYDKNFGTSYCGVLDGVSENLFLGGIRYKLAAGAYVTAEYGLLTNSIDYRDVSGAAQTMDITKHIVMSDVTVNF